MIVLDASALVDVVTDQPAKAAVMVHMAQPIAAPAHQLAEVISAVARMTRAGAISASAAADALEDAGALHQRQVPIDAALLSHAYGMRDRIRVLDALYVAVADRLSCPLLTTDARLARAQPPCEVLLC